MQAGHPVWSSGFCGDPLPEDPHSDNEMSDAITEAMNSVINEVGAGGADPFVSLAARYTLERIEW